MTLDEPIQFYLKNKAQIDEWAALAKKTSIEADQFFRSIASDLVAAISDAEGDPVAYISLGEKEKYPKLFLHREEWRLSAEKVPIVAIGVEWIRASVQFDTSYRGVWIDKDKDIAKTLKHELSPLLKESHNGNSRQWLSAPYWPIWQYVIPSQTDFWVDLEIFRQELIDSILECWRQDWKVVDEVVTGIKE